MMRKIGPTTGLFLFLGPEIPGHVFEGPTIGARHIYIY
jgi:hypothetical protein